MNTPQHLWHLIAGVASNLVGLAVSLHYARAAIDGVLRLTVYCDWSTLRQAATWLSKRKRGTTLSKVVGDGFVVQLLAVIAYLILVAAVYWSWIGLLQPRLMELEIPDGARYWVPPLLAIPLIVCLFASVQARAEAKLKDLSHAIQEIAREVSVTPEERKELDRLSGGGRLSREAIGAAWRALPLATHVLILCYQIGLEHFRRLIERESRGQQASSDLLDFVYGSTHLDHVTREREGASCPYKRKWNRSALRLWADAEARQHGIKPATDLRSFLEASILGSTVPGSGIPKQMFVDVVLERIRATPPERRLADRAEVRATTTLKVIDSLENREHRIKAYIYNDSDTGCLLWFSSYYWEAMRPLLRDRARRVVFSVDHRKYTDAVEVYSSDCMRWLRRGVRVAISTQANLAALDAGSRKKR